MKPANIVNLDINKCREIGQICACYKVRKAARVITKLYDEALRPINLRVTQLSLLMTIRILETVTVVRLAQAAVIDRTTLTRNIQLLEKRGLIKINPGEDRREREITLTADGVEALAAAIPFWEEAQNRIRQELGEEKMHNLLDDLSEMISLAKKK